MSGNEFQTVGQSPAKRTQLVHTVDDELVNCMCNVKLGY